jgi:tetratricopeptide (TPR) repeat protein
MRLLFVLIFCGILANQNLFGQKSETDLIKNIQSEKSDTIKFSRMMDLFDYYVQNDLRKAKHQLNLITQFSQKLKTAKTQSDIYQLKGKYYLFTSELDSSIYWYKKFFYTNYAQSNISIKINALNNLGNSFNAANQLDSAFMYLNQGLELARKHKAKEICPIFNNLGLVLAKQLQYQDAIKYFELAYNCFVEKKEIPATETIINLASLYAFTDKSNSDEKIQDLLRSSLNRFSRNDLLTIYTNLGLMYVENHQAQQAKKLLQKADSIQSLISEKPLPNILHGLAKIEILNKNPQKAFVEYQKIYSEFPTYSERLILINDLARLSFDLGKYEESKNYYDEIIALKDSIYHTQIENTIAKAQKDSDHYQKEIQVKNLEIEKQNFQSKQKLERIMAITGGLILVLLITWIWIYYKKEKAKRKISELEIEHKNLKINEFYDKIEQRNQVIKEIETSFEEFKKNHAIQDDLKQTIIDSLDIQGDREFYNLYFEDQHKGFYSALKMLAPDLTNNELRLCSLTKLRMSLKETAHVLNLSVDAIKSGRYRIKKKLNLEGEDNLSDFLNQLNS